MDAKTNNRYTYTDAGYSRFYRRSIDSPASSVASLRDLARTAQTQSRAINFDSVPLSGNMSGVMKIGDTIKLDGDKGRISIFSSQDNEVTRLGSLRDE